MKSLLEIVIPTYRNPACMNANLECMSRYFAEGHDFFISVYDSSEDDETQKIVEKYANDRIVYHRLSPEIHVDEKTVYALKHATGKYVLLGGDGNITKIDEIFHAIDFEKGEAEIYLIYNSSSEHYHSFFKDLQKTEYTDKNEFFSLHYWYVTFYGGSICKSEIFHRMDENAVLERFKGCNLIYPNMLATISNGPYRVLECDSFYRNPHKNSSGWILDHSAVEIWAKKLTESVERLRGDLSDEAVEEIIRTTNRYNRFFTAKGLMSFRCTKNFDLKIRKKYKPYLKKCLACSWSTSFLIALCPRFILLAMRWLYKKRKPKTKIKEY